MDGKGYRGIGSQEQRNRSEENRAINNFNQKLSNRDLSSITPEEIVRDAEEIVKSLPRRKGEERGTTRTQIRNLFNIIHDALKTKSGTGGIKRQLILAKPKIAYMCRKKENKPLVDCMLRFVDKVIGKNDDESYEKLRTFVEALVAYERYYGDSGGDKNE